MKAIWSFITSQLQQDISVILLYVVDSQGSSPGRQGFMMAINQDHQFVGTIGGGIMEVKLIELAKSMLSKNESSPQLKLQYHDKDHQRNQSGMICSGHQMIALLPIRPDHLSQLKPLLTCDQIVHIHITEHTWQLVTGDLQQTVQIKSDYEFDITCPLSIRPTVHIFGAGHVGHALEAQMHVLGYNTVVYDDRDAEQNKYDTTSSNIIHVDYKNMQSVITARANDYAVIVSFGYRSDKIILKEIINLGFNFIGMMGSDHKIETLRKELISEGLTSIDLDRVHMPIGIPIYSKTAAEIAVSISAQIIKENNKHLPHGRSYT